MTDERNADMSVPPAVPPSPYIVNRETVGHALAPTVFDRDHESEVEVQGDPYPQSVTRFWTRFVCSSAKLPRTYVPQSLGEFKPHDSKL